MTEYIGSLMITSVDDCNYSIYHCVSGNSVGFFVRSVFDKFIFTPTNLFLNQEDLVDISYALMKINSIHGY